MIKEKKKGIVFYVSTNGNDAWSGKLTEPNASKSDGPFATLARARDAIRRIKARAKGGLKKPVTVIVRGGKYYLDETFVLGSEDNGVRECPITYTAYPGEKPILSGGRKITGWKPCKGKILQCELPESKGGKWKFRQLFFNGQRQIRARYPNFDPKNPLYGGWLFVEDTAEEGSLVAFKYKPGTFKRRWAKPSEAEVFMLSDWGETNITPIKRMDKENRAITMADGLKDFNVYPWFMPNPLSRRYRFYVENLFEELDQPGEWCLDSEEGILYFWPPTKSIEDAEIVAPVLDCLIDLRGASWITISGFTFTETTSGDNMHRQGHEGYGAMFPVAGRKYCGEAVHMKRTEHCCIEKNLFYAVGGNAVYLEDYNARNFIQHNEISYAGSNGVCLVGSKYFHGMAADASVPHHPIYNEIVYNHIHHCGVFDKYVAGVFLGLCDGNVIGHNLIERMPHHGINLGNSGYGRNIIEYNEIRHTCLETYDNGAINSWMEDPHGHVQRDAERSGHIIRYNLITDTVGCTVDKKGDLIMPGGEANGTTNTQGVYLDSASNCFVYGNIIVRSERGIFVHGGKNNIIENNIIVDCRYPLVTYTCLFPGYAPQMGEFMTGNRCCRNIFYCSQSGKHLYSLSYWTDRVLGQADYNLFFNAAGGEYIIDIGEVKYEAIKGVLKEAPKRISLTEWQEIGYDEHSVIADPLFVDPEHDDYGLRPESPVFKLGFEPIDVTKIGLRIKKNQKGNTSVTGE